MKLDSDVARLAGLVPLCLALFFDTPAAQVPHPDSAFLLEQAEMIGAGVPPVRLNPGGGSLDRSDMAIIRLAVVLCTQIFPSDSTAARARCYAAAQNALASILIQMGPCTKNVRTNREGKRECWRLVNDTWTWAPMFSTDSASP